MKDLNNLVTASKNKTRLETEIKAALDGTGLTSTEWNVIHALYIESGISGDIAKICGVKGPSLTRITPKLVERKIISKYGLVGDDRMVYLQLTKKGAKIYEKLSKAIDRCLEG